MVQALLVILLNKYLKNKKYGKIFILSRDEAKQHYMKQKYQSNKIEFIIADVRDIERLKEKIVNVDVVFHAAALKHVPSNEFNPTEVLKQTL